MTSLKFQKSDKPFSGFKFSYSRGEPSYKAPKLLTHKKQEEFFIGSLYAHQLVFNNHVITGIEVCQDDSNKGADVVIHSDKGEVKLQITRFTLTNYLQRKHVAEQRATKIATEVLRFGDVPIPVIVTLYSEDKSSMPRNKKKDDLALAQDIAKLIKSNLAVLRQYKPPFVNCTYSGSVKNIASIITLQAVPPEHKSNYPGKGNVTINYDFDNIAFSEEDIAAEAEAIFNRKNGGTANTLIIWIDEAETLHQMPLFTKHLKEKSANTTFDLVLFICFYNDKHLYFQTQLKFALIFDQDSGWDQSRI